MDSAIRKVWKQKISAAERTSVKMAGSISLEKAVLGGRREVWSAGGSGGQQLNRGGERLGRMRVRSRYSQRGGVSI